LKVAPPGFGANRAGKEIQLPPGDSIGNSALSDYSVTAARLSKIDHRAVNRCAFRAVSRDRATNDLSRNGKKERNRSTTYSACLANHFAIARNFEARIGDILQRKKGVYGLVLGGAQGLTNKLRLAVSAQ